MSKNFPEPAMAGGMADAGRYLPAMAKGQHLTRHQQGIVRRYYEHLDTLTIQKLSEIVSDLYLADSPKKTDQLWKRAETSLRKAAASDATVRATLQSRDVKKLAQLVTEMTKR